MRTAGILHLDPACASGAALTPWLKRGACAPELVTPAPAGDDWVVRAQAWAPKGQARQLAARDGGSAVLYPLRRRPRRGLSVGRLHGVGEDELGLLLRTLCRLAAAPVCAEDLQQLEQALEPGVDLALLPSTSATSSTDPVDTRRERAQWCAFRGQVRRALGDDRELIDFETVSTALGAWLHPQCIGELPSTEVDGWALGLMAATDPAADLHLEDWLDNVASRPAWRNHPRLDEWVDLVSRWLQLHAQWASIRLDDPLQARRFWLATLPGLCEIGMHPGTWFTQALPTRQMAMELALNEFDPRTCAVLWNMCTACTPSARQEPIGRLFSRAELAALQAR